MPTPVPPPTPSAAPSAASPPPQLRGLMSASVGMCRQVRSAPYRRSPPRWSQAKANRISATTSEPSACLTWTFCAPGSNPARTRAGCRQGSASTWRRAQGTRRRVSRRSKAKALAWGRCSRASRRRRVCGIFAVAANVHNRGGFPVTSKAYAHNKLLLKIRIRVTVLRRWSFCERRLAGSTSGAASGRRKDGVARVRKGGRKGLISRARVQSCAAQRHG